MNDQAAHILKSCFLSETLREILSSDNDSMVFSRETCSMFRFVIKMAGVSRGTIALKVRSYIKFVLIFSRNWFFVEVTSLWEK